MELLIARRPTIKTGKEQLLLILFYPSRWRFNTCHRRDCSVIDHAFIRIEAEKCPQQLPIQAYTYIAQSSQIGLKSPMISHQRRFRVN